MKRSRCTDGAAATDRAASRIAWCLLVGALACTAVGLALDLLDRGDSAQVGNAVGMIFPLFAIVPFSIVGALIVARRPGNRIGRLMLGIGVILALAYLGNGLGWWGMTHPEFSATVAGVGGWFSSFTWSLTLAVLITRLLLLFPDGELPSPRWRVVSAVQVALIPIAVLASVGPGPLTDYETLANPFGISALGGLDGPLEAVAHVLFLVALVASAAAIVVRFRRSRGVERLQLKWMAFSVSATAATIVASAAASAGPTWLSDLVWLSSVAAVFSIPVVIGIAVLRYRLYEIDRVINRTLVYAAVTLVLGVAYVGLVLAGQAITSTFTGSSNLAIAASTLVVAALFLPVRSRVQRFVDRRFYRRRYDAQRTLEGFGARLREQIDLGTLEGDLRSVVGDTMQPTHVALWRRETHR
jgi:hypothetical protein